MSSKNPKTPNTLTTHRVGRKHITCWVPTELADQLAAHLASLVGGVDGVKTDLSGWLIAAIHQKLARDVSGRLSTQGLQGASAAPRPQDVPRPQDAPRAPEVPPVRGTGGTQATSLHDDFEGVRIRVGVTKPRAGYVHWRSRRHVVADALEIDIPAEVIHHADLMTENVKPTALGWKRAEKLIAQVKDAQAAGKDPAPLWARWMPAGAR